MPVQDPLTVAVGGTLDVTIPSAGLGGADLAYVITPQPLPANMTFNRGTGELTFDPAPGQVGTYSFDVAISDGTHTSAVHVPLTVGGPSSATTEVSGLVVDEAGKGLGGVPVMLGDLMTTTDASGEFTLAGIPASPGPLTIDGFQDGAGGRMMFTTPTEQLLGHAAYADAVNVVPRPITLPRVDAADAVDFSRLDPSCPMDISSPAVPGFSMRIAAGDAMSSDGLPFAGKLAITPLSSAQASELLPAGSTANLIELDAAGLSLDGPVQLTIPNTSGLAAGAETDLYAMNMVTGGNDLVGRLRVDPGGATMTTVDAVSLMAATMPSMPATIAKAGGATPAYVGGGTFSVCIGPFDKPPANGTPINLCNCPVGANVTMADPGSPGGGTPAGDVPIFATKGMASDADMNTGAYYQDHQLVAYQSQGQAQGVDLEYSSQQADPYMVVQFEPSTQIESNSANIVSITAQATLAGVVQGAAVTYNTPGGLSDSLVYRVPLRVDATQLATGSYTYSITVTQNYGDLTSASAIFQGYVDVVNRSADTAGPAPYGAGWGVAGLQQVSLPDPNGPALVTTGTEQAQRYDRVYNAGGSLKDLALVSLAGASSSANTILANDGMADFTAGAATTTAAATSFATGDFNGDGVPDLAEISGTTLSILLGGGSGGKFTAGSTYTLPSAGASLVAGNFTGHTGSTLDLAVLINTVSGSTTTNKVAVYQGSGTGTFSTAVVSTVGTNQGWTQVAAGRFTGTARTDMVAYAPGATGVEILQAGTGSTFAAYAAVALASPNTVTSVIVVDANHDGKDDLIIAATPQYTGGPGDTSLDYYANAGTGTFASMTSTTMLDGTVGQGSQLAIGNFYNDGSTDVAAGIDGDLYIAITSMNSSGVWGNEQLSLGSRALVSGTLSDVMTSLVAADFNGDGKDDLAFANTSDTQAYVILSNPDANQMEPVEAVPLPAAGLALAAGAFAGHAATPGYRAMMGETSTLVHNVGGTWTRTYTDQSVVQFDSSGRETSQADRDGNTTHFAYVASGAAAGALQTMTDPVGLVTTLAYDGSGHLASVTDPASRVTTVTVDTNANLTKFVDPDSAITQYGYSTPANHLVTTEVNPDNKTATAHYDGFARLASETLFDGTSSVGVAAAEEKGLLAPGGSGSLPTPATYQGSVTDADGHATTLTFDSMGHPVASVDSVGGPTTITRDMNGWPITVFDPAGRETDYQYDMMGNVTKITRYLAPASGVGGSPRAMSETIAYDPTFSEPIKITDFLGLVTTFTLDSHGNVTRRTDPDSLHEDWTYNSAGQVLSDTDRNGHTTSFTYNSLGRLTAVTEPNAGAGIATIAYGYDTAGDQTSVTDEVGDTTSFTYDLAGRVLTSQDPVQAAAGVLTSLAYDPAGNLTSVKDALGHVTSYAYDARNRLLAVVDPVNQGTGHATSYGYDAASNLTSVTDPLGHATSYAYDADNRLTTMTDALGHATVYTYDPDGEQVATTDANGHVTSLGYDSLGRVISMSLPGVGGRAGPGAGVAPAAEAGAGARPRRWSTSSPTTTTTGS